MTQVLGRIMMTGGHRLAISTSSIGIRFISALQTTKLCEYRYHVLKYNLSVILHNAIWIEA